MPGNTEGKCVIGQVQYMSEKSKCLEKLNQMQKFIPFLDFMIDKIKKKNIETSLECQLSKFQLLRSMIAEKNGKYSWEIIVKVEDIIEKLISKLDFKDQYEKSKEFLAEDDSPETSAAASVSVVPSPATGVSLTITSSEAMASDPRAQDLPTYADLIMKTLKISADDGIKKTGYRGSELLSDPLGSNRALDITERSMETDLDKDLDGFDLTDCPVLSEKDSSNVVMESVIEAPGKVSTHDDLLSSSRERLLKSLQSRLFPCKTNRFPAQTAADDKSEKATEKQINSAFSRGQIQPGESKSKCDFSESSEQSLVEKNNKANETSCEVPGKHAPVNSKSSKPLNFQERIRTDPANVSGDSSLKQKLKEKLSTDICEVYRVPGKSVGGSLRSLKESKDRRKSFAVEEDELFKPDRIPEKGQKRGSISQSRSSSERRDSQSEKSQRDSSASGSEKRGEKTNDKVSNKHIPGNSGKKDRDEKRPDCQNIKSSRNDSKSRNNKSESGKSDKEEDIKPESKISKEGRTAAGKKAEDKNFELEKLNDEELLEFVKENMQSLPHLAKLKSSELKKAVQSSFSCNSVSADADSVSEISDDSFHDLDDDICGRQKSQPKAKETDSKAGWKNPIESKETHPSLKTIVEPRKTSKVLEGKGKSRVEASFVENPDEEDYAIKLIEETTPKSFTHKKKKGLLELPMPAMDDLFEDISSIESFETSSSPPESRDPRLAKSCVSSERKNKPKKQGSNFQANLEPSKVAKEVWPSLNSRPAVSVQTSRSQTGALLQRSNQERVARPEGSHGVPDVSQHLQSNQFSNRYPSGLSDSTHRNSSLYSKPPSYVNDPRRHSYISSEPKSYAEYKRLKQKEHGKISNREQTSKENPNTSSYDGSVISDISSRSLVEREDADRNASKKNQDPRSSGCKETSGRHNSSKNNSTIRTNENRRTVSPPKLRRHSDHVDSRSRDDLRERRTSETKKDEDEKMRKIVDEKRHSLESEELVSPLEELYRSENKPKTGRGYGIQNFKIPKKGRHPFTQTCSKSVENQVLATSKSQMKNDATVEISGARCEVDSTKGKRESEISRTNVVESTKDTKEKPGAHSEQRMEPSDILVDSTVTEDVSSDCAGKVGGTSADLTKTDSSINEVCVAADSNEKTKEHCENPDSGAVTLPAKTDNETEESVEGEAKTDLTTRKTDIFEQVSKNDAEEQIVTTNEPSLVAKGVKKCEAEMVECDSSMESSLNEQRSEKESAGAGEKNSMGKEEITQEFVEALIRKSFQSGEGKLLLAQVKLFEELARKLNSKKLKTIQRIINSESCSSSSSSDSSSEDEKKRKKSKKSEQKSKKRKKKGKRGRKHKSSSLSSTSESEGTSEDDTFDKKEDKTKINESSVSPSSPDNPLQSEESKSKSSDSLGQKSKSSKRRRNLEFGRHFGRRKTRGKQNQNKLLEKLLKESPQREIASDSNTGNVADVPAKELEPKSKPRPKGKAKTELDRLHDDIRSMFISAGVVTATGQRMCRILKQSGGNMNNLDIVKESAKMVEEEKLKKVQTRTRNARIGNAGSSDNSRSQSLDKGTNAHVENDEEQDPKLKLVPRVALQRVDLDNFGYGIKVSEDCISFRRMQGRNTAIRGTGMMHLGGKSPRKLSSSSPVRKVFLERNKRKFERLKNSKLKKSYTRKKLMDVVKNLPLKMARMKHLQICEKKTPYETAKKKKSPPEKLNRKPSAMNVGEITKTDISREQLLNHAFDKNRKFYACKLCSQVERSITEHYKDVHPEHEVLISRLTVREAKLAKLESAKNNYDRPETQENCENSNSGKRQVKPRSRPITYHCRMCFFKVTDVNTFASHVSTHTGEGRYQCPVEGCGTQAYSRENIKFHILLKHGKNRYDFYNRIIHSYQLTIEGGKMFGYLCSVCNFVQICLRNLENHILRQHDSDENAKIIKINMSSNKVRRSRARSEILKVDSKINVGDENEEDKKTEGPEEVVKNATSESEASGAKDPIEPGNRKRKQKSVCQVSDTESDASDVEPFRSKRMLLDESSNVPEMTTVPEKSDVERERPSGEEEIDVEGGNDDTDVEDCVDLKRISNLKGSDIISSMETPEPGERRAGVNPGGAAESGERQVSVHPGRVDSYCKVKVGPLEALISDSPEVLYDCYVKGCLFSTRVFDLFEKHIKISHWKNKWNGVCQTCRAGRDNVPRGKGPFKLLTALHHLKLHERIRKSHNKLSVEDLIMELKLSNPSGEGTANEESDDVEDDSNRADVPRRVEEDQTHENSETPYPTKPLLRVRNLLGDRLSTPKADENEMADEETNGGERSPGDSSKMFTIENVRSLTETATGEGELKIGQVCSLKGLVSKPPQQGKAIIVRSCPTRKIAIRPETSPLSVDVGHVNVVQPPVVSHAVVLNPLPSNSPIRILGAALSPNPKFTVKPMMIPADSGRLNSPNVKPIAHPSSSPTVMSISPDENSLTNPEVTVTHKLESNPGAENPCSLCKIGPDVEVITSPTRSTSPGPTGTVHHVHKNSTAEAEEALESIQKFTSTSNAGKKSVKDAKIYKEMLTKRKLCDLFKCMGIECSFTCNDENVFTQHIGLHEAQRRLKRNKGIKTMYIRSANKTTRAYYWQQCAYCCEVLSNSDKALSNHILEEHGHCMFQCAFCFYRAVSHRYVEIHQSLAHGHIIKTTPRVIYKCKPLKVSSSESVALERHGRKQSVRPYHCDQCGQKFYITQDFMTHLSTEHQSVTAYTCHICKNLCFKVNRLINHYKLHSYCTYQCPYCLHGTETEKEMVFHLCNFHFSQPAIIYVRALAEGQKNLSSQLDSLKVIVYDSDTQNLDCIVEADSDEGAPESVPESSTDLSAIAAELGIITETQSTSTSVTPLIKELASIGDKSAKHLTVKSLLPNAQFSSEHESGIENCSVLISSGLSVPSDSNNEREMNIPLGQLPLEAVNVQRKEIQPPPSVASSVGSPDRNLRLNEIIINLQKDKSLAKSPVEEEKTGQSSAVILSTAVHKLPPVVLGRSSTLKSAFPVKGVVLKKKLEGSQNAASAGGGKMSEKGKSENEGNVAEDKSKNASQGESTEDAIKQPLTEKEKEDNSKVIEQPLITNIVSLSNPDFDKEESTGPVESEDGSVIISDICSLSPPSVVEKDNSNSAGVFINSNHPNTNKSAVGVEPVLKPPIIRVEDFPIDEDTNPSSSHSNENVCKIVDKDSLKTNDESEVKKTARSLSPDIIILENEKRKDIVTVVLDSDDEKAENVKKAEKQNLEEMKDELNLPEGNKTIRKEIELLRNQIASETDSLLIDVVDVGKPKLDLTLNVGTDRTEVKDPPVKTLLSPIEEAICSLNKKLKTESQEVQKSAEEDGGEEEEEEEEEGEEEGGEMKKWAKAVENPKKSDGDENKLPERPRTRFGARERRRGGAESADKSDADESGKKDDSGKAKKFKKELVGKELFICGNEKCDFAADNDSSLKDHLYVCDLSRESSMLVCPHCARQMKQFHPYLEHLKYHGEKKHHCGLCEFSSAVDTSVSRHIKQKHKFSLIKVLPKESKEGHLLYYPKNYKVEKIDFEVNGYSPGDEDKLPLQSVYQVNVKCAKCPYFTKVRSNMVRHLKIHVKSVETEGVVVVPSTAPTNPVPCLESKERMFDKMTNLAASSQLAQAKEKTAVESLSPEEEAKLPQYVPEQMRYKCCLPDCNYITIDDGMLRHHIKALHDEINYYSCPHCKSTVHVDVRHVTLDKIGFHLKHHDSKLYKCAHCIYFHYQKNVVEKHTVEKHPDRRYFLHTVREPKLEVTSEEEPSSSEGGARVWKCGLCDDFQTPSKSTLMDHLMKSHNTKSKYKCKLCPLKGNNYQVFSSHFASKHAGEKVSYLWVYYSEKVASNSLESQSGNSSGADSSNEHFDTTPLWQRGAPRVRHIRGILIEEEEVKTKKSKKASACESEPETADGANLGKNAFYCPLCTNKKKPFFTRNKCFFRTHLYQELNYQQFACMLCGKMFVDRKEFERHHTRAHADKPQAVKQTKEDHEIKFWVDQVIAKQWKQMKEKKRKERDEEAAEGEGPAKKKKEV